MEEMLNEMSEGEASDDGLKIVIESPKRKSAKKPKSASNINPYDKQMIETIEKQMEDALTEKAAKSNLTTTNVKSILRQVVTNEHVMALVRQTEHPDTITGPHFEPKLTRAKAKELFSCAPVSSLPWASSTKTSSEVQKLISDELAEDSSGDEYVPAEEESEDDRDSYALSEPELRSVSPATPVKEPESPREVHWTDDGVFKIPPAKTKEDKEEEAANIALRTRSKLSLSSTPLEVIEEAFIPPDITTDMYDMDCDDDEWCDFLTKFTRPLDEITKANEDEDHDPEYNILADEEVDEVDTEELRADKAVKVSRKELNDMLAELYEYANAFAENQEENSPKIDVNSEPQISILESSSLMDTTVQSQDTADASMNITHNVSPIEPSSDASFNDVMQMDQKLLLEQQMREHVQMLTQNFILSYQHPEFHDMSIKFKENLFNLQLLAGNEENSSFKPCNLEDALKLVKHWEHQFESNTDEVKAMKQHVFRVLQESKSRYASGVEYVVTFPTLILETISKSDVFIYPDLLPRIPFKSASLFKRQSMFVKSEDELITFGLDQFIPYLAQDKYHLTYTGEVKLKSVCAMIVNYMMPMKDITKLYCHIFNSKHPRSIDNPIKRYFENKRPSITLHYVRNLEEFGVKPPCKRSKEVLPYHWRQYLYPEAKENSITTAQPTPVTIATIKRINKPPSFNKNFSNKSPSKRRLASKPITSTPVRRSSNTWKRNSCSIEPFPSSRRKAIFSSTPSDSASTLRVTKLEYYFKSPEVLNVQKDISPCIRCMKFNSSIFKKLRTKKTVLFDKMLPSMPFLSGACNNDTEENNGSFFELPSASATTSKDCGDETNNDRPVEADSTIVDGEDEEIVGKDNEDDINALMIASSTIKNLGRRGQSGAEKKKAKLRREYSATLAMLSPEDPTVLQEKAQSYAQAYFDKAREHLQPEEYQQFMEILNGFNEKTNCVSDLYKQIENILGQDHKDLMEEFLTFLTPAQAKDVGKLIPYYMLSNMSLFLRKLEIYFKEQPAQLRKIYRSLTDLSTCVNVNMDRVKNTILPLLKGNSLLTDWFLQIFPCEPPPESLLKGPWEHVDVRREVSSGEDVYETINLPEVDDPYGGPNCSCSCHEGEDPMFKSRSQHCIPCGLKFLQGRVYIQTGKGLRLANVTFNGDPDVDHNLRLNCSSLDRRKRRSETSPSKQVTSPLKDCQEEVRANDSEDETECSRRRGRITRSPRKKKTKLCDKSEKSVGDRIELEEQAEVPLEEGCDNFRNVLSSINPFESINNDQEELLQDISTTIAEDKDLTKPLTEEVTEWDCNTSIESTELKQSPEHSAESESEFCEESSQDNINTETDDSAEELESLSNSPVHSENSNSNTFEEISWTRDEDKIILETLQKEGGKEEAFVRISEVLGSRSILQIKERFRTLMSLLQKMTSSKDASF